MNRIDKFYISAWCAAHNAYRDDIENHGCAGGGQGSGLPKKTSCENLYHAGRKLFEIVGMEPHNNSLYKFNPYCEPADTIKERK